MRDNSCSLSFRRKTVKKTAFESVLNEKRTNVLTLSALPVPVDVVHQMDPSLTCFRWIFEERMFQQLLRVWPTCVVFDETHFNKAQQRL